MLDYEFADQLPIQILIDFWRWPHLAGIENQPEKGLNVLEVNMGTDPEN